jgi:hypothetical protein
LADGVKFPIFLSKQSPLVKLIVIDVHIKNQHCGAQILLSEFRMRFWTPQIRNLIRNTLYFDRRRKCLPCFAFQAKPYDPPPEPPLPIERMQAGAAFQNVGIDFFGPFYCRTGSEAKKAYGCIFACFVTRAVHLEVITDMTADRFLLALRRFISRRGTPRFILSDNAPQFKLAAELIQKQWWRVTADDQVKEFLVVKGIKWNFITTYAPWRGALYERLIALVKHGLRRVVGKKMIELEELDTLFAEAERVVNLRPLTTMTDGEISRPLRPIDFLQPKTDPAFISEPDSKTDDPDYHLSRSRDSEIDKLTKLYQKTMVKVDCFWVQWRNDYLLALRERWQTGKAKGRQSQPEIGQTVIIHDENLPRNLWKMGVVVRLESSRTALVKTSAGKELRRAVNHLFPLEIEPEVKVPDESAEEFVDEEEREEQVVPANEEAEPEAEPNKRVRKKKRDKIYIYDSDEEYEEITASAVQKLKARKQSVTHTLWTLLILFILSLNRSVQGQRETILKGETSGERVLYWLRKADFRCVMEMPSGNFLKYAIDPVEGNVRMVMIREQPPEPHLINITYYPRAEHDSRCIIPRKEWFLLRRDGFFKREAANEVVESEVVRIESPTATSGDVVLNWLKETKQNVTRRNSDQPEHAKGYGRGDVGSTRQLAQQWARELMETTTEQTESTTEETSEVPQPIDGELKVADWKVVVAKRTVVVLAKLNEKGKEIRRITRPSTSGQ